MTSLAVRCAATERADRPHGADSRHWVAERFTAGWGSEAEVMQVNIHCAPAYALAYCYLEAGESMRAEAGAMAAMSAGYQRQGQRGPRWGREGPDAQDAGRGSRSYGEVHRPGARRLGRGRPRSPGDFTTLDITPHRGIMCEAGAVVALSQGFGERRQVPAGGS